MAVKIDTAKEAALEFFKMANPEDEFLLVIFSEHAQLASRFSANIEELGSSLLSSSAKGRTALLDAIYLGLSEMRSAHNAKRALLIISDGGDNNSRYSENDIKRLVREANTQLYAVGIFDPVGYRNRTPEELNGPSLLSELTELTVVALLTSRTQMSSRILRQRWAWSCATNIFWDTTQVIRRTMRAGAKSKLSCVHPKDSRS